MQRGQRGGLVDVGQSRRCEGGADDEEGRDQLRVPEGCAVDDRSAPVVAAQDDAREAEVAGEGGDVIGGALECADWVRQSLPSFPR